MEAVLKMKKTGCPRCGKPTSGTPTEEGFKWAYCNDCLAEMDKNGKEEPGREEKPDADKPSTEN